MCFVCSSDNKQIIAEHDVEVWKVVGGDYRSIYHGFHWVMGKDNPSVSVLPSPNVFADGVLWIEEGYHAYTTLARAKGELLYRQCTRRTDDRPCKLITCIIPKGTKYYASGGECVAERMVFVALQH